MVIVEIYFIVGLVFTLGVFLKDFIFNPKSAKDLFNDPDIPAPYLVGGTIAVFLAMVVLWPYPLFINIKRMFKYY